MVFAMIMLTTVAFGLFSARSVLKGRTQSNELVALLKVAANYVSPAPASVGCCLLAVACMLSCSAHDARFDAT